MSKKCNACGSHAINHHLHGRDGNDLDLCDVCYWRKRHGDLLSDVEMAFAGIEAVSDSGDVGAYIRDDVEMLRSAINKAMGL